MSRFSDCKELKNLRSTNTPADHHHAIRIDAVNLKHRLRNIDTDRANLTHGRLPSMWLRFDATTLWHSDAAEWAPSTASLADKPSGAKIHLCPLWSKSRQKRVRLDCPLSAN